MKPVLTEAQLKRLKEYKFNSEGKSLLDPVLQDFSGYLLEKIPFWVAPNVISFLGLAALVVATFPLFLYCPTVTEEVPWWFYTTCIAGLFTIQTLDNMDGLQARRVGSGSPIGAVVDSACDVTAFGIVVTSVAIAMQLGTSPELMFYCHLLCFCIDFAMYWKNGFFDVLYYELFEVNEYLAVAMMIHSVSAIFGPAAWSTQVFHTELEARVITVALILVANLFNIFGAMVVILKQRDKGSNAGLRGSSPMRTACPLLIHLILAFLTKGASSQQIVQNYPTLYYLMLGLAHAKVTIVLRVADATKSEMPLVDTSMLGPAMLFLSSFLGDYVSEYFVLCLAMLLVTLDLVVYSTLVLQESCDYLNISCFKVKEKS
ncbi:choline/ethanolaminephosphotransferase 1-like isoform X1 [Branchiostoma floridae]|uniref:Choline/ethanolaminephosphotransferase 1-like isoform X1 n=1 Tax=Branchiostoma floridae TaxID=7739 RepID=A0A9J7MX73_BRAFL|nr:choline/ethanolaminephosphotransferase 1-like isoform X1 [Branchiostoma floridae]